MKENEVLARFMGYEEGYDEHGVWQKLQYNTSWSWLMPVVEKIESMGYFFIIKPRTVETYRQIPAESLNITAGKTKIEAVFKACVEFIEWYNANKQL